MVHTGILLSNEIQDKEFAQKICASGGLLFIHAESFKEIRKLVSQHVILFCSLDIPESEQISLIQNLRDSLDYQHVFYIGNKYLNEYKNALKMKAVAHYFRRGLPTGIEWGKQILSAIQVNHQKPRTFLYPTDAQVKKITIKRARDRNISAEAIANVMEQKAFPPRLAQLAGQCVDELLMNAIFDAPIFRGNHYRIHDDRNSDFELSQHESVDLQIVFLEHAVLISVTDLFGSLSRETLLTYIAKDYTRNDYHPKVGNGAGLGIYGIIEAGISIYYSVSAGKSTQATLIIPTVEAFKDFRKAYQVFSFMQKN